jgi:Na+-driven multidrug efflux pump
LQFEFQSLFIAAEKPRLGLFVTVGAGVTNMILDWLLTAVFPLGITGAACATAISQLVGGVAPLVYFSLPNSSILKFRKTSLDIKALVRTITNGSSELMSNLSMSLVSMLYNFQLIKYAGEDGVSAYGVLMYVSFVFISIFIGFSVGIAPVISYHYGAQNERELKSLLKKSLVIIGITSVFMLILGEGLASPLSKLFVGYDKELYNLTLRGFFIFSFSFLFSGIAIFGSAFFTALNN